MYIFRLLSNLTNVITTVVSGYSAGYIFKLVPNLTNIIMTVVSGYNTNMQQSVLIRDIIWTQNFFIKSVQLFNQCILRHPIFPDVSFSIPIPGVNVVGIVMTRGFRANR